MESKKYINHITNVKRMNYLKIIFVFLLLYGCNKNKKENIKVIDFDKANKADFYLSDIADSITYIPLDSTKYFRVITVLKIYGDYIIANTSEGIFVYDREGKFISEIGKKGEGPMEISVFAGDFTFDSNKKQIYVLEDIPQKIKIFTIMGDYVKTISLKSRFDKLEFVDNKLFLFESITGGYAKYDWLIMDLNGDSLSAKKNTIPAFKSGAGFSTKPYRFDSYVCDFDRFKDTVYCIDNNGQYHIKYLFKHKSPFDMGIDHSEIARKNSYHLGHMFETEHYVFLSYGINFVFNQTILNKKTGAYYVYAKSDDRYNYQKDYLFNDIDGGKWTMINSCFFDTNSEYLCLRQPVLGLKDFIQSDEFKNEKVKYPERKEKYRQFVENLKDDANPVLMMVKLKQ